MIDLSNHCAGSVGSLICAFLVIICWLWDRVFTGDTSAMAGVWCLEVILLIHQNVKSVLLCCLILTAVASGLRV